MLGDWNAQKYIKIHVYFDVFLRIPMGLPALPPLPTPPYIHLTLQRFSIVFFLLPPSWGGGDGRYSKKNKIVEHTLGIVCRRTFLVRRRTKCSSVLFVDVRRRTSTNIDEQVPATRATHDEQRRTSTNKIFFSPHDEHRRTFCSSAHYV